MRAGVDPAGIIASDDNHIVLAIKDLSITRGGRQVLHIESLDVYAGEVLAVIGPNGAGKSTLLLALARLLPYSQGQVYFHDQPLEKLQELGYRRCIGLVLQEPLLLDTTVFDNVAAGLRFRGISRSEVNRRVEIWLEYLGISSLRRRPARDLSGGEAQRVSLARAFVLQPEVLLLDEPFSSLDAPTRLALLDDLQKILEATAMTTIFITHDLDEALYLGERVAVILEGSLRQVGAPHTVFSAPSDPQVAAFVGVETVIAGQVVANREGHLIVQAGDLRLEAIGEVATGRGVLLCLRPEDVTLWPENGSPQSSARNRVNGRILRIVPQGALVRVVVDCGFNVVALITRTSYQEMELVAGRSVTVAFKASAVHLIPR
jgi:tungstate transport system ATP-binding protein